MRHYCLSLVVASSIAAIMGSQSAHAAATELCAGPALVSPFITGTIKNGSSCNLDATGTTVTELFIGVSANDTDILQLGSTPIFNNQQTDPGTFAHQTVTAGQVLNFNLDNTNDPVPSLRGDYFAGTPYTNAVLPFGISTGLSPVYHFAYFTATSAADVNTLFGAPYINSTFNTIIQNAGGYSSFIFVGVEDSKVDQSDDWNDTIYAFQSVALAKTVTSGVPEASTWVMMIMGFAGLGFAGYRASRKAAAAA
jgi:hypothetical protein